MALFLAPKIRVNGISSGPTLKSKNQTTKQFKDQIDRTPLKKQIGLDEINNAVDYIFKNKSITGEVLTLDSGQSLDGQTRNQRFSQLIKEKQVVNTKIK